MIRLIQRRLIIPRGDTGSFTIPILGTADSTDIAVFSIFNPETRKKIFEKRTQKGDDNTFNIEFSHDDTINLMPGKYVWDIKVYKNPQIDEEGIIINGDEVNSYYAGFSLPICEIKETAEDWPIESELANKDRQTIVKEVINALPSAIGVEF